MNALILAAGKGTRLRPITNTIPKPLVKIDGISLLQRQIDALLEIPEIDEIIVTVSHLKDKIYAFFSNTRRLANYYRYNKVNTYNCPHLMGTAEATMRTWEMLDKDEPLLILYGDVYFPSAYLSFGTIIKQYLKQPAHSILGASSHKRTGQMQYDENYEIKQFIEGPKQTQGPILYHAGFLVLAPWAYPILESIVTRPKTQQSLYNLGEHFLPLAVKRGGFYALTLEQQHDIGTIEEYRRFQTKRNNHDNNPNPIED